MKRIEQLKPLSREHHHSLVLAQKAIRVANAQNTEDKIKLCQDIVDDFALRWESHFQKEEKTIFALLDSRYKTYLTQEYIDLIVTLKNQHEQLRTIAQAMKAGAIDELLVFGQVLKEHTQLEERILFPLISDLLSEEELNLIEKAE